MSPIFMLDDPTYPWMRVRLDPANHRLVLAFDPDDPPPALLAFDLIQALEPMHNRAIPPERMAVEIRLRVMAVLEPAVYRRRLYRSHWLNTWRYLL